MTNKWKNIVKNILYDDQIKKIEDMLNNFKKRKSMEFEISFREIYYQDYIRIIEKYVDITKEENISSVDSLDISIILENGNVYRVSILDPKIADSFIKNFSDKNKRDIQKYVLELNPSNYINIIYKNRGTAERLYVENLNLIFKLTEEISLKNKNDKPRFSGQEKILYRYKNRYSFGINENVRIDATEVRETSNLKNLLRHHINYEIEMEIINHDISYDIFINEFIAVLKVVQNSQIPIDKLEAEEVVNKYYQILNIKPSHHLETRNAITLETQHIIRFIPNKYAITDKADGERHFLLTTEGKDKVTNVYLLTSNLRVKKIDLGIKDKKYSNMILDGELVENENGCIFLVFDVVFANNVDYRTNDKFNLIYRINILNNIVDECFGNLIPFVDYMDINKDLEPDKIRSHYQKEIKKYWELFWEKLNKNKEKIFVTRKLYFVPYGIDSYEIFMYADLVWKQFVYGQLPPYKLDGVIYTPINLPYMIKVSHDNLDTVPLEYKWKPSYLNSIDFYIRFEKDAYGNDAIFYDNSVIREEGRAYKICRLYVGITRAGEERPIPFKINGVEQVANIYLVNDEAVDTDGNVINDGTVVEFIYDITKTDLDDAYKWIPLRIRYDKTESARKYHKKYGNHVNVASRIWRTIINPITEEMIASLGNPLTYQKEITRISKTLEAYSQQNFVYYQKKTANAAGMRAFNNWIKSNMILTYCRNKYSVLDIGCGRGGDLIKFVHARVKEYVGIDIDSNGLYVINDSAYNRYKSIKRKYKNAPTMIFIHADARALFTVKAQLLALPTMTSYNKKLIETYLSGKKKYDIINIQFSIHYYLSDELSWENFCKNVRDHLTDDGYLLITCFDGKMVYDKLYGKQKMTISYTDNLGNKEIFFEIIKGYNDDQSIGVGMAIDLYNSLISNPGTYIKEYLVFPDFLQESLKKNVGLELVETDTFYGLFNFYRDFFLQDITMECSCSEEISKKYRDIKNFYLSLSPGHDETTEMDAALASFKFTMLNRYYVFKKTSRNNIMEQSRIVGIKNKPNLGKILLPYFDTNRMAIDFDGGSFQINKIYHQIRKEYAPIRPSVYLIRHSITKEQLDNENIKMNKLEFSKIKEGNDNKILLIYKSPDKHFYPIYYQSNIIDPENLVPDNRIKREYLLDPSKIIGDIDVLVALTEKMKQIKNK